MGTVKGCACATVERCTTEGVRYRGHTTVIMYVGNFITQSFVALQTIIPTRWIFTCVISFMRSPIEKSLTYMRPKRSWISSQAHGRYLLFRDKNLSESMKIHIIKDHLFDTFELSGKSLLTASDEMTEATRSALRIYDETHKSFKGFVCLSQTQINCQF